MQNELMDKMVESLKWFISEDETNRGDEPMSEYGGRSWNEINAYWIAGLDNAIAILEEYDKMKGII